MLVKYPLTLSPTHALTKISFTCPGEGREPISVDIRRSGVVGKQKEGQSAFLPFPSKE